MTLSAEQIKNLASSGEGFNAEFKISAPSKVKELTEEACAFANAAGGVILIGVDDSNQIRGATIDNGRRSSIQDALRKITPPISCNFYMVEVDGKEVWAIEVPSGPHKPYVCSGAIFVRVGPNTQKLTSAEEMRDFFQQSDRIYFDEGPCAGFDPESELDEANMVVFRAESGFSPGVPEEQLLSNLQLFAQEGVFKNGAVLFFGEAPERHFNTAVIRCLSFRGTDKRFITDDKSLGGPLYRQYQQAMEWLRGKLDISYDIEGAGSGPRVENWEIPQTAFRESIINALSHRDYYDRGGTITIEVFEDRVEIANPGGLVSGIKPKDFGRRSLSRNPLIFGLFQRMHMVEKVGSGIGRMRELLADARLPEPDFIFDGMFTVVFKRPIKFEEWLNLWADQLTDNRASILRAIRSSPSTTIKEMKSQLDISDTAIGNHLQKLKELGLVERIGTRGGRWKLTYKKP